MGYYSSVIHENRFTDYILKWVIDVIIVIMLALFFVTVIANKKEVDGSSMSPTIETSEEVLINELAFCILPPSRYDVVAFEVGSQYYIKRIVGLPGETVQIKNGNIYINGDVLEYNQSAGPIVTPGLASNEIELDDDEYFVLGDNWNNSEDSRFSYVGNISRNDISGKVWFVISPIKDIRFVKN